MNKAKQKIISELVAWLERANSNKMLNIILMGVIILSTFAFFVLMNSDFKRNLGFLIVPIISTANLCLLGSRNHIIRETANFLAAIIFIGFLLSALTLIFIGLIITKSL